MKTTFHELHKKGYGKLPLNKINIVYINYMGPVSNQYKIDRNTSNEMIYWRNIDFIMMQ